jgi:hypothetical protein
MVQYNSIVLLRLVGMILAHVIVDASIKSVAERNNNLMR